MTRKTTLLLLLSLLMVPATSRADKVFSLVIGVNRPLGKDTKVLRYADDDAVLNHRLLSSVGYSVLLVTPDPATNRLHGKLSGALAPTRKNIEAALGDLFSRIREAHKKGEPTQFYFVYSGHGDDQNDQGYLALADGRFTSRDLADKVLARTGATTNHVIIDACRSYFMAFVRRAGGKRRKTRLAVRPDHDLASRFPNTGFLLSTSSGTSSHEWEGFQAGIFSHEVRSGLQGAADINRNGQVSYGEIWAFIQVANFSVRNQRFRPEVFMRAPGNDASRPMMDMRSSRAHSLTIPAKAAGRFSLENSDGVRVADLHPDGYAPVTLWIPGFSRVYVRDVSRDREYLLEPARRNQLLATLFHRTSSYTIKGAAHEAFNQIFSEPFSRAAYSRAMDAYRLGTGPPMARVAAKPGRPRTHGWLQMAYDLRNGFLQGAGLIHGFHVGYTHPLGPVALGGVIGYGQSKYDRDDQISINFEELSLAAVADYRPWRWGRLGLVLGLTAGFHWGWQRGVLPGGERQEISRPFFQYLFRAGAEVHLFSRSSLLLMGHLGQAVHQAHDGVKGPFTYGMTAGISVEM